MELNPNDSCAYDWSGRMYYDLGRYQEAVEVFQQEIKLWPNVNGYLFLGNAYTYSERPGDAVNAGLRPILNIYCYDQFCAFA